MKIDVAALPDDPQLLREVLCQHSKLEEKYRALFYKLFRPRSERLDENQLSLIFESMADMGIEQEQLEKLEEQVAPEKKPRKKRAPGTGRKPLPKDLPRERVEHLLPEAERCCGSCGTELAKIREEISEQLEYIPASFKAAKKRFSAHPKHRRRSRKACRAPAS